MSDEKKVEDAKTPVTEAKVVPPTPPSEPPVAEESVPPTPKKTVRKAVVELNVVDNGIVVVAQAIGVHEGQQFQEGATLVYSDTEEATYNALAKLKDLLKFLPK